MLKLTTGIVTVICEHVQMYKHLKHFHLISTPLLYFLKNKIRNEQIT